MHLVTFFTNIIGAVTIGLVSIVSILGLICLSRSIYFQLWIKRSGYQRLSYFNGPWLTRITLILVAFWWGIGEILRLTFVNGEGKFTSDWSWQENICKFYIISNLGFAEPGLFLLLAFLLNAALQKQELGTLNQTWNRKTIRAMFLICIPSLLWEAYVVFIGPYVASNNDQTLKLANYWFSASAVHNGNISCKYPLLSSIFLGAFYITLTIYMMSVGNQMLSLVINKGLRRRIYMLIFATTILLPRVILLGLSIVPWPSEIAHEFLVFISFMILILVAMIGIVILVYFPVADTFSIADQDHVEMQASHTIII